MFKKAKQLFNRKTNVEPPDVNANEPVVSADTEAQAVQQPQDKPTIFAQLKAGLRKTRDQLADRLQSFGSGRSIDEDLLEDLEELLIAADLGVPTTTHLLDQIRQEARKSKDPDASKLRDLLHAELKAILDAIPKRDWQMQAAPMVVLVAGVNGVGKTTTIGKLAHLWMREGKSVVLCAADTFRAAATEQLEIWAQRAGVVIVKKDDAKDPASVVFDAIAIAKQSHADILLVDTAGRLHNNPSLMNELSKIRRITEREVSGAPHHVLLVLDAVTGQNGLHQAKQFVDKIGVTDLIITKLDGTAKGGVAVAISNELKLPIQFVGVGEKMDDLLAFDTASFTDALLS